MLRRYRKLKAKYLREYQPSLDTSVIHNNTACISQEPTAVHEQQDIMLPQEDPIPTVKTRPRWTPHRLSLEWPMSPSMPDMAHEASFSSDLSPTSPLSPAPRTAPQPCSGPTFERLHGVTGHYPGLATNERVFSNQKLNPTRSRRLQEMKKQYNDQGCHDQGPKEQKQEQQENRQHGTCFDETGSTCSKNDAGSQIAFNLDKDSNMGLDGNGGSSTVVGNTAEPNYHSGNGLVNTEGPMLSSTLDLKQQCPQTTDSSTTESAATQNLHDGVVCRPHSESVVQQTGPSTLFEASLDTPSTLIQSQIPVECGNGVSTDNDADDETDDEPLVRRKRLTKQRLFPHMAAADSITLHAVNEDLRARNGGITSNGSSKGLVLWDAPPSLRRLFFQSCTDSLLQEGEAVQSSCNTALSDVTRSDSSHKCLDQTNGVAILEHESDGKLQSLQRLDLGSKESVLECDEGMTWACASSVDPCLSITPRIGTNVWKWIDAGIMDDAFDFSEFDQPHQIPTENQGETAEHCSSQGPEQFDYPSCSEYSDKALSRSASSANDRCPGQSETGELCVTLDLKVLNMNEGLGLEEIADGDSTPNMDRMQEDQASRCSSESDGPSPHTTNNDVISEDQDNLECNHEPRIYTLDPSSSLPSWAIEVGPNYVPVLGGTVKVTCENCFRKFTLGTSDPHALERHQSRFCSTPARQWVQRWVCKAEAYLGIGPGGQEAMIANMRKRREQQYRQQVKRLNDEMDECMVKLMALQDEYEAFVQSVPVVAGADFNDIFNLERAAVSEAGGDGWTSLVAASVSEAYRRLEERWVPWVEWARAWGGGGAEEGAADSSEEE